MFRPMVGFDGVTGGWANDGRVTFRIDVFVSSDFTSAKDGGCRRRPICLESACRWDMS